MIARRSPKALVLEGAVVTFDPARPTITDGAVYVGDGTIEAVQARADPPPTGFATAPRLRTRGVLYPGLIDLHNHLAYNFRSLWFAPRAEPYTTRYQWPDAPTYATEITRPAVALGKAAAKAVLKFAEAKAVVGGVTAIQGSPKTSRPYEGWMIRNVEHETFGTGRDVVRQSVLPLDVERLQPYGEHMRAGSTFIYHLAEGTSPKLVREFEDVSAAHCLEPGLIGIHATALGATEFERWGERPGSIVWSPFSNLWLYRRTTDVVAARDAGIRICLGADWAPSGSKNVLGELKVADLWNRTQLGRAFSDRELCEFVTANPGDALAPAWGERIGRLKVGLAADLVVVAARRDDAYRNLIEATERHVRLVVVGGRAVYGSRALLVAAGTESPEPITVAGASRAISMLDPAVRDADMTWQDVRSALARALENPARAFDDAQTRAGPDEQPLELEPDMPGGELARGIRSPEELGAIRMPPLDSLFHDAAFIRNLERDRAPILDGLLDGLRQYYLRDR